MPGRDADDGEKFDVYVLSGRGYGGEEVWESITASGSVGKKEADILEERLKGAGKDIMVRLDSDPPDSPERLILR